MWFFFEVWINFEVCMDVILFDVFVSVRMTEYVLQFCIGNWFFLLKYGYVTNYLFIYLRGKGRKHYYQLFMVTWGNKTQRTINVRQDERNNSYSLIKSQKPCCFVSNFVTSWQRIAAHYNAVPDKNVLHSLRYGIVCVTIWKILCETS